MITRRKFIHAIALVRYFSKPSYYHFPGSEPLKALTVGNLLEIAAEKWPNHTALVSMHENQQLTFAEAKEKAEKIGAKLVELGMKPGDRIATFGGNTVHWYLTALAAAKAGLILTGLNPNYEKEELFSVLQQVGVKAIISDTIYKSTDCYKLLSSVIPELNETSTSSPVQCSKLPELKLVIFPSNQKLQGTYRFNDFLNHSLPNDELENIGKSIDPDQSFDIQFTSGTTGTPKAAVITHFGAVNNAYFFGKRCGFGDEPAVICHQVPFFHIFGTVLGIIAALHHGATIVLPGLAFNKQETVKALMKNKCTVMYGTPTMHRDVCTLIQNEVNSNELLKKGLDNVKVIVTGGAYCNPQLAKVISQTFQGSRLQSVYGMSEASPITFTNSKNDTLEQRTSTVGLVADHQEVKVVDQDGNMVPFGTPGEVWFRGYSTMVGYWNDEVRTSEIMGPNRWLKSGDLMVLNEDGYGTIVGRCKEQINRGGEKIMPSEVEIVLETHPCVEEVYVHGVADDRMGEEVCACIRLKNDATLSADDVISFCKGKLARFKIPKYVKFMESFPVTGTGKVMRINLKKMFEEEMKKTSS